MSELIASTKFQLKQIIPRAKDIVVKVQKDQQDFISKIHIQMPGAVLHAEKRAETFYEALDSSCQAVIRQFSKIKTRKLAKKRLRTFKSIWEDKAN